MPGVLADGLGLFFLTGLLLEKPGSGHPVRGRQQVGRVAECLLTQAYWWGGQPEGPRGKATAQAGPLGMMGALVGGYDGDGSWGAWEGR